VADGMRNGTSKDSRENQEEQTCRRRISKELADEVARLEWEQENLGIMENLLEEKAKQCEVFKACLLENQHCLLAEASPNKLWSSGQSPYVTSHTAPHFWPGKNILGGMLRDLTEKIMNEIQGMTETEQDNETSTNDEHMIASGDDGSDKDQNEGQQQQSQQAEKQEEQHQLQLGSKHFKKDKQQKAKCSSPRGRTKAKKVAAVRDTPVQSSACTGNSSKTAQCTPRNADIRTAFQNKRKEPASSPQDADNKGSKQVRKDSPETDGTT